MAFDGETGRGEGQLTVVTPAQARAQGHRFRRCRPSAVLHSAEFYAPWIPAGGGTTTARLKGQ